MPDTDQASDVELNKDLYISKTYIYTLMLAKFVTTKAIVTIKLIGLEFFIKNQLSFKASVPCLIKMLIDFFRDCSERHHPHRGGRGIRQ